MGRVPKRVVVVGIGLLGAGLLAPALAPAASVKVESGILSFQASPTESNRVSVDRISAGFYRVRDDFAPLTAGTNCLQQQAHQARCEAGTVTEIDVNAADGNDVVRVLDSSDNTPATLSGGPGRDELFGGRGNDELIAGPGPAFGFEGELLDGGRGNDTLRGPTTFSNGTHILRGGPGHETFLGGPGTESMEGGGGADDFHGGGGGFDAVDYLGVSSGVTVTINDVANDGGPGEGDNVRTDVERVFGTNFDDVINGSAANNELFGQGGIDTLRGGDGNDFLSGGAGEDTLISGPGDDFLQGGFDLSADDFRGGPGIDTAGFSDHSDPLEITIGDGANDGAVGEGDNVRPDIENVVGGSGNDRIVGDDGDNLLEGNGGGDIVRGEVGNDSVHGDRIFASSFAVGDDIVKGDSGDDLVTGGGGSDTVVGADGNDRLFGESEFGDTAGGDDLLRGGSGSDLLRGGVGADDLKGGLNSDVVDYSERSNSVEVTINDVANDGEAGESDNVRTDIEMVVGGSGDDKLTGSPGNDILFGGPGNDEIRGQGGDDLLGGEIPSLFQTPGDDFLAGGNGTDTVTYESHFQPVTVTIDNVADDGQAGEADDVRANVENLIGGNPGDSLTGSSGSNVILGGPGFASDTLNGLDGADFLVGERGFDTHNGDGGNDQINSRDDNLTDTNNCGVGTDTVFADGVDLNNDCENVFTASMALSAPSPLGLVSLYRDLLDDRKLVERLLAMTE